VYVAAEELQLRGGPRTEVDLTIILPNWLVKKKILFKHMYKLLALGGLLTASC
jgi:hypothetical protein